MRKRWNYTRKRADYKGTIRFPLTDDQRLLGPRDSYREYDNLVRNAANRGSNFFFKKKTLEHLWWLSIHPDREPTATAPQELMHTVVVLILALSERLRLTKDQTPPLIYRCFICGETKRIAGTYRSGVSCTTMFGFSFEPWIGSSQKERKPWRRRAPHSFWQNIQ